MKNLTQSDQQQLIEDVAHDILSCLRDDVAEVRSTAIEALILMKVANLPVHIIPMLKDESPLVRAKAAMALGKLTSQDAIQGLVSLLSDKTLSIELFLDVFNLEIPAFRVCDYAFHSLLNFNIEVSLPTIKKALLDDDNLLKAHAIKAIELLHKRSTGVWSSLYMERSSDDEQYSWKEITQELNEQEIIKQLVFLLADSSPVIAENMASEWVSNFYEFYVASASNAIPDNEINELVAQLRFLWSLPIGFYAAQSLSIIRDIEALQSLVSAITSPSIHIRATVIEKLGSWLLDFPDSGWSVMEHRLVEIDEEIETLRQQVIEKLIILLDDRTPVDELLLICDLAAKSLEYADTERAKNTLEKWRANRQ